MRKFKWTMVIPFVFAYTGQKLIFDLAGFNYSIVEDGFDITNVMIAFGVYMALAIPALYVVSRFDPGLFNED